MGSETFELKRFGWASPDRLEIAGKFVGLEDVPAGDPVLVLRGAERTHRLVADAADGGGNGSGEDWHASFAWQDAPTAFDAAELELGDELLVALPEPRADDDDSEADVLEVRRRGAGERLRLESELLALRSRLSDASAQLDRAHDDLTRAQADLEAERAARAADAEEFRASLEQIRATAEEAVTEGLGEVVALRARVASLAGVAEEAERLRERLTSIRDMLEEGSGAGGDAGGDATST